MMKLDTTWLREQVLFHANPVFKDFLKLHGFVFIVTEVV